MEEVRQWLLSLGYDYTPKFTGKIERWDDGPWFVGHSNGKFIHAIVGNFRAPNEVFRFNQNISPEDLQAHREFINEAKAKAVAETEALQKEAAAFIPQILGKLSHGETPYTKRKGIKAPEGTFAQDATLLIPVRDIRGTITSLQYIFPSRDAKGLDRKFIYGGKVEGSFHQLGKIGPVIILAEGIATAQSVYEATGACVLVCFSAGNLKKVAKVIRQTYDPEVLLIAADNDQWTLKPQKNPGLTAARDAAIEVSGHVCFPRFVNTESKPTDFNDLHLLEGLDIVREFITDAIHYARCARSDSLQFTSIKTLLSRPRRPMKWAVDRLLPMSGSSLLLGKAKSGKSTLVHQAIVSVAKGEPFLSRPTVKGPVLYVAAEEIEEEVLQHLLDLGYDANQDAPVLLHVAGTPKGFWSELSDACVEHGPRFVVLDTLSAVLEIEDYNAFGEVNKAMKQVERFAKENRTHVMLTHHLGKAQREGMDAAMGSTSFQAKVDTMLAIDVEKDERRLIRSKQRYGQLIPTTYLKWDPTKRRMELGNPARVQRSEDVLETLLNGILGCGWLSREQLEAKMEWSEKKVRSVVAQGIEEKKLVEKIEDGNAHKKLYKIHDAWEHTAEM